MKFCTKCGKEVNEEAVICPGCGCPISNVNPPRSNTEDKASGGLIALSILIPIAGVILWPVKHKETPKAAMTYGLCGIIAWVVYAVFLMMMTTI